MSGFRMLTAGMLGLGLAVALAVPAQATTSQNGAMQNERASSIYTDALNAFMAHGWHGVTDMKKSGGMVMAMGVNSNDKVRHIIWDSGTGNVQVK